ncbi:polysaccharide pyruvyl transferase family protein [Mucisphaera calidilacus]|uniref:Colanic acid biosynthesis protein n=1 Tax=Mucisphaera calidilacus TaxID=2527982 RepID=A0A518BTL7_9BACT|nr:polysaccharide pyruvyl transferase family protein [Mucisphaera calidilacus]QDU70307.1 colanic acid biosynthesis protein [Mucisphaera calidilacus]
MTRILIEQSGYGLGNAGDVAMLLSLTQRIRRSRPDIQLSVLTDNPERLTRIIPNTTPVDPQHKGFLTQDWCLLGALQRVLPDAWKPHLLRLERKTCSYAPRRAAACVDARPKKRPLNPTARQTIDWLDSFDGLIVSGGGFLTDVFKRHGQLVLLLAAVMHRLGKPVAMLGQGIGPADDPQLRSDLQHTLPRVDVLGLREGAHGPRLLNELRVPQHAVTVTGDEALPLVRDSIDPNATSRGAIGINIRAASYAGLHESPVPQHVADAAQQLGRDLQPLPISWNHDDNDITPLKHLLPQHLCDEIREPLSPTQIVRLAGRCDLTVTGSYHAALFSLAQGIPVIGIAANAYYQYKFQGLAERFDPRNVTIINPNEIRSADDMLALCRRALDIDDDRRADLRQRATLQAQAVCDTGEKALAAYPKPA